MNDRPTLSIVIVNWNTRDYLHGALNSIYSAPPDFEVQTIVVDNASTDGSAEMVLLDFLDVDLIASPINTGYAAGNNIGLKRAVGEYILLLNPDVVLPNGCLQKAVEIIRAKPGVSALGVKQLSPDGSIQRSVRGFPKPASVMYEALGLSRVFANSRLFGAYRMTWFDYSREAPVDQPMGTFLLIPRVVLEQVGLLDERFPIFFNEVDWCYRASLLGMTAWYTPEVEILHYGGGSTRQVKPKMAWESRKGLLDFYRKHYTGVHRLPIYWLASAASWLQAKTVSARRSA